MLTTMLLACHVVGKKVCTLVFQSHFETLLLFSFFDFFLLIYVMNRTVIFQTYWNTSEAERCFWYQWARSGAGAGNGEPRAELEWLLNARSEEGKLLTLHSAHILCWQQGWQPFRIIQNRPIFKASVCPVFAGICHMTTYQTNNKWIRPILFPNHCLNCERSHSRKAPASASGTRILISLAQGPAKA